MNVIIVVNFLLEKIGKRGIWKVVQGFLEWYIILITKI